MKIRAYGSKALQLIINLRGVSTKLNKYIAFTMQTYKKLMCDNYSPKTTYSFIENV